ncbi:MAG: glucose-6-phosphate isomerase [Candidatus Saccharibacteria bacterium]|nr:glucose-6-phosphate isomerase [Candidatus Saccharibacteria bacterium]
MIKFLTDEDFAIDIGAAKRMLAEIKTDPMSGWLNVWETVESDKIQSYAKSVQENSDFLVCIGIGGSYLGHRAIIEALGNKSKTKVLYAGNSLSDFELNNIISTIKNHDFSLNVISKSGTTFEPAIAFRILKKLMLEKYGPEETARRIFVTTDSSSGVLRKEAERNGYTSLEIPDSVGGRYSVLSNVGLLPLAVAGLNIKELLEGARVESENIDASEDLSVNKNSAAALRYAVIRTILAQNTFDVEVLATFEPRLRYFTEWWKQLFGESEGKNEQGIFPAATVYSTDLHSLGQYLQEGRRNIFETFICFDKNSGGLSVPEFSDDFDGLKYLEGRSLSEISKKAETATIEAHRSGAIPVFEVVAPDLSEKSLGALIYFFELACAISAKLQGVNPFDQPGVERYKENMSYLLKKS